MRTFSMSMYVSREKLLEDKVKYLEERNVILLNRLHQSKRRNREDKLRLNNEIDYWFEEYLSTERRLLKELWEKP